MNLKTPVEFYKERLAIVRERQTLGISETFAVVHTLYSSLNINGEGAEREVAIQCLITQWGKISVSTVGEHL